MSGDGEPLYAAEWLRQMKQCADVFPDCESVGVEIRDNAGRVFATFANEFAADAFIRMLDGFGEAAEQWAADEKLLAKLQASDEGHQQETIAAETKHQDEKRRADALAVRVDDQRIEIADLTRWLEESQLALTLASQEHS